MVRMRIEMDNVRIETYGGLHFRHWDHLPSCPARIERAFPYCALNFAYSGRIDFREGAARAVRLNAPVAWWTRPGVHYKYGAVAGEVWDHRYVTFTGLRCRSMRWFRLDEPCWGFVEQAGAYAGVWEELFRCLDDPMGAPDLAVNLLDRLFLLASAPKFSSTPDTPVMEKMRGILARWRSRPEIAEDWRIAAREAGVSPAHFRRVFGEATGMGPYAFQLAGRLAAAAEALRETNGSLKEIAARVGFEDPYHFSRAFKKRYGCSPSHYREQIPTR